MKTSRIIVVIVSILLIIPLAGHLFWLLKKPTSMDLLVVNKSVNRKSKNEFKSLAWVLNYHKIRKSDKELYDYTSDYLGYYPDAPYEDIMIKSFRLEDLDTISRYYDGLYYLDNLGVNSESVTPADYYGGFNQNDYLLLKEMLGDNKLIVAEYNFFSSGTQDLVKYNTEQLIDIYSLGWNGKFFHSLERSRIIKTMGPAFINDWEEKNGDWNFRGEGILLIESSKNRVLILPREDYMNGKFPVIKTDSKICELYKVPESIGYDGWFEISYEGRNQIVSEFDLNLNERGEDLLKQNGLNMKFPAVIKHQTSNLYYLAGDFSKRNVFMGSSRMKGVNQLFHSFCNCFRKGHSFFFQNYYVPLVSSILSITEVQKPLDES